MERRKDRNGRVLRAGESQNKDGRYMYVYRDYAGKRKYVYSWRLTGKDAHPKGKKMELSLKEKEAEIESKLNSGFISTDSKITVLELVKKYIATKNGVRQTTKIGYQTVMPSFKTNFIMERCSRRKNLKK